MDGQPPAPVSARPVLARYECGHRFPRYAATWACPAKTGSHDRLPAMIFPCPRTLRWGLHHNPRGRDGERSTDAGNGIAVQVVVGVVAGAGVRIPALIHCGSLANFQRSRRVASAESIKREIEVGEVECPLAGHLPRAVTRACHRKRIEGKLVGFRVASTSGVSLNPLEGVSRYGHGVEP